MAEVALPIGGRTHVVQCRAGQEEAFRRLGTLLDRHWPTAARAAGTEVGERPMLFVALMLADQIDEIERRPLAETDPIVLERIADRLEALATALEEPAPNA